ncbi:MAG TPA: response regulator [Holophagaceae bacterium]|nr:response regulator [Holophagaceae bacterium]
MDLLLVEDKDSFRDLLVKALAGSDWAVTAVGDPAEALARLEERSFPVLVTDLRLPGLSGLELIRRAKRLRPELRAVLMSAFGEPKDIVEAMKLGTDDFLPKPFDLEAFLDLLARLRALATAPPPRPDEPWIALSPAMRVLEAGLRRAADTDHPVLFTGPRGSGKGRAARRLHALRRPGAPFRTLRAESLAESLEEARLRSLAGGSLHLAEAEQLPAPLAEALARALETPAGRAVAWSAAVTAAEDLPGPLRHRLDVLRLDLPPLDSRPEDIPALFLAFLARAAAASSRPAPRLERGLERGLLQLAAAGGAHALELAAVRALLLNDGTVVRRLPDPGLGPTALLLPEPAPGSLVAMEESIVLAARPHLLRRALQAHQGSLPATAEALGLTARSLAQRLREAGIPLEDEGTP